MLTQMLKNWRVLTLLIFLVFALIAIRPTPWNEGVMVRSVSPNSSAFEAGISNPKPNSPPLAHENIIAIDNIKIKSLEDYNQAIANLEPNQTLRIVTDKSSYILIVKPLFKETILNETETKLIEEYDNATNKTIIKEVKTPKIERELLGIENLGIKVAPVATSNLRKGLDLIGGSRVLLQPDVPISKEDTSSIIQSLTERLNVYGLSDVTVRDASDLEGNSFIVVEIAGVTEEEVSNLLAKQGKFESKISNQTVFIGGKQDIPYVCRTAECSGLDPQRPCGKISDGTYGCSFFFSITLSPDAARRQAEATRKLDVITGPNSQPYLSAPIELYLDDKLVDTLQIAAELKGQATTNIAITGGGAGRTRQEAANDALQNMKRLQTILITGSLPVKLSIVKMDTISPTLGERFTNNLILLAVLAFLSVAVIITAYYRSLKIALPMIVTLLSEVVLTLGFAALVGWNLDVAAMAGIILSIGTGVDHLVVIADEIHRKEVFYDWKRRLKNAMFIVFGAYIVDFAGMIPLWFAGAGLLKGFAFTTIAGISFGVIIARPAYAAIIKILLKA